MLLGSLMFNLMLELTPIRIKSYADIKANPSFSSDI